jgi:hypothetical protein
VGSGKTSPLAMTPHKQLSAKTFDTYLILNLSMLQMKMIFIFDSMASEGCNYDRGGTPWPRR